MFSSFNLTVERSQNHSVFFLNCLFNVSWKKSFYIMTMSFIYIVFLVLKMLLLSVIYLFQIRIKNNKQYIYYRHFTIMEDE